MKREHGFPKSYRLIKRADFALRREGVEKSSTGNFNVIQGRNGIGRSRLGIIVSRRVGNAVIRNRTKRLLREFFRLNLRKIDQGKDIIIIANRGARIGGLWDVENELRRVLLLV